MLQRRNGPARSTVKSRCGFLNTSPLRNDSICSYFLFAKWSRPVESGGWPWAQWESRFPEEEVRPPERFSSPQLPRRCTWNGGDSPEIVLKLAGSHHLQTQPVLAQISGKPARQPAGPPSWPPASPVQRSCSSPSRGSFFLKVSRCHSLIKTPAVLRLILNEGPMIWPLLTSLAV